MTAIIDESARKAPPHLEHHAILTKGSYNSSKLERPPHEPKEEKVVKRSINELKSIIDKIIHNEGSLKRKVEEILNPHRMVEEERLHGVEIDGFVITINKTEDQDINFSKSYYEKSGEPETILDPSQFNQLEYKPAFTHEISNHDYDDIEEQITSKILKGEANDLFTDDNLSKLFGKKF